MNLTTIILSTAAVAFFHTLIGPDHYLPILACGRSKKWSLMKTCKMTGLFGLVHILAAVGIGAALSFANGRINVHLQIVSIRGELVSWLLMAGGVIAILWHMRKSLKTATLKNSLSWFLLVVFIVGPCEPLIPFFIIPQYASSPMALVAFLMTFGTVTIVTMVGAVALLWKGVPRRLFSTPRWASMTTGLALFFCGLAIQCGL